MIGISCSWAVGQTLEMGEPQKKGVSTSLIYKKFETKAVLTFPVQTTHKKIKLRAGAGTLLILPHEENDLRVDAMIRTTSLSKKKNREFIKEFLKFKIIENENEIYFKGYFDISRTRSRTNSKGNYSVFSIGSALGTPNSKIDLIVKVPKGIELEVYDGSGKVEVRQITNDLYIEDNSGNIVIEQVSGKMKIVDAAGKITLRDLKNDVTVHDQGGKLWMENIQGNVDIKDTSGDLTVQNIQGNLSIKDTSGKIIVKNVSKALKISDQSGRIEINEVATSNPEEIVEINDNSGHIYLTNVKGNLKLKDGAGKVVHKNSN